jgi:hypothetical protein
MKDYFSVFFEAINRVLQQHSSFFEGEGLVLFQAFATIILVWAGLIGALSSAEGGPGFSFSRFLTLLMEIAIVNTMLRFYSAPIPGIGVSFTHLILNFCQGMIAQLNQARMQELMETLDVVQSNIPFPSPYELLAIFRFIIVWLAIAAAQALALGVTIFGYAATAVLVLLGPVFIPFFLLPKMDWLFWGWFRAFIQYAFYGPVAAAYVFVFGDFLMQLLADYNSPLSTEEFVLHFPAMVLTLAVFCYGLVKIPSLTFSLFSGRSGEYVFLWRK